MVEVQGRVEPGFEAVKDAFARNFTDHGDVGAAYCAYLNGRPVVDIWGGVADQDTGRPWEEDTITLVFSTTKGATAICAHMLAERGDLDFDAPVARYWPEFAAAGKGGIPVRWLLSHKAGLAAPAADISLDDIAAWNPVIDKLAAQAPNWPPGSAHGYHAVSYGWLVGEVVRRVTGMSLGTFFAKEVAAPLGLDFFVGLPEEEEPRVATLIQSQLGGEVPDDAPEFLKEMARAFTDPTTLTGRVFSNPRIEDWNSRLVRGAEMPAANGIGSARALARMYAATIGEVDGIRLLRPETVDDARRERSNGPDRVLFVPTRFGLGFMLYSMFSPMGREGAFGHPGAGGSVAFAHPEANLACAYVMNRMNSNLAGDPRTVGLNEALYASLDRQ